MADFSKIPVSVEQIKQLKDNKLDILYGVTIELAEDGKTIKLKNGKGAYIGEVVIGNATTTADGLMSNTDKTKLDGIDEGANAYELPTATDSVLGGVKLATSLDVTDADKVLAASVGATISAAIDAAAHTLDFDTNTRNIQLKDAEGNAIGDPITLPEGFTLTAATASDLGGVAVSANSSISNTDGAIDVKTGAGINVAADGTLSVTLPSNPLTVKGKKGTKSELPTEGNVVGDMWLVGFNAPYQEYVYVQTNAEPEEYSWEVLGTFSDEMDFSDYVAKADFLDNTTFINYIYPAAASE